MAQEENEIIKTIAINPVKVIRQSKNNPYMRGLVMKRGLTHREACHIYRNIFLFDINLSLDDIESNREKKEFYDDITKTLNSYIKGDVSWNRLCDCTYCWDTDDDSGPSIASHLKLVQYLQKKGVI